MKIISKKYYFKAQGENPNVVCLERCMVQDNGTCIGSVACQKCKHHLETNIGESGEACWIKCAKIKDAIKTLPK